MLKARADLRVSIPVSRPEPSVNIGSAGPGLACSRCSRAPGPAQSPVADVDDYHSGDHDGLERGTVPEHGQINGPEQIAQEQARLSRRRAHYQRDGHGSGWAGSGEADVQA